MPASGLRRRQHRNMVIIQRIALCFAEQTELRAGKTGFLHQQFDIRGMPQHFVIDRRKKPGWWPVQLLRCRAVIKAIGRVNKMVMINPMDGIA